MVWTPGVLAGKAFQRIHPDNPLNKLCEPQQRLLYSMLFLDTTMERIPKGQSKDHKGERLAKLAAEANRIAAQFELEVFQEGYYSDLFGQLASDSRDVPRRFMALAQFVGGCLDKLGKPGHKERNEGNTFFILATEFVRLTTGAYNDEHLADLYQFISERSGDYSAEAIRKKRERLRKAYPTLVAAIATLARRAYENTAVRDPS
jgi:hypothetical protein